MQLNLPILDRLADSKSILIAGAGGGFDVFVGLPLYFTLNAMGKVVHLASYSFTDFGLAQIVSQPEILLDNALLGARAPTRPLAYYPEGYLSKWFEKTQGENVTVWMFAKTGVVPLIEAYEKLIAHLGIDALILVDGGVDSLMRGDEAGPGSLVEDSISLTAVESLNVPVKILACLGFGTETEEGLCHHHALENIAALAKDGTFLGSCALTSQMEAFQLYESAARYVWEQPHHAKSHISTRVIPATHGEFGNFHMYQEGEYDANTILFISPLMSLYWFFDAPGVIRRNMLKDVLRPTATVMEALSVSIRFRQTVKSRPRQNIPY